LYLHGNSLTVSLRRDYFLCPQIDQENSCSRDNPVRIVSNMPAVFLKGIHNNLVIRVTGRHIALRVYFSINTTA
jgi:hypothetical protein